MRFFLLLLYHGTEVHTMNERFADMIRAARKCARLTVERAADMLFLTPRALQYYEAGKRRVPDDMIARMVKIYGSMEIGYRWLSKELITGRLILPANGFLDIKKAAPTSGTETEKMICRHSITHIQK